MATHSSTLAWQIPWTEEPGWLQSMGSLGVRHDWATSLSLFTLMHWRRKWPPTPVFLPGESQGWGSLVGCLPSMGPHGIRHDWSDSAAAAANCMVLRNGDGTKRKWMTEKFHRGMWASICLAFYVKGLRHFKCELFSFHDVFLVFIKKVVKAHG